VQNSKGAGVEQRVLQALMVKRFPKIVAQLERADSSVEVQPPFSLLLFFVGAFPERRRWQQTGPRAPLLWATSFET
jgi:hypothetical protein